MPSEGSNRPHKFQVKNSYYLRISKRVVLMMKILVDQPHLHWFNTDENSKVILSKLIEILKPRILGKLEDEIKSNSKKSKLDIYRGSGFQFGYYFRNQTYQHSILLKSKELIHPIQTEPGEDEGELEDTKPDDLGIGASSFKVHYQPFSIFGKSLVVVIEPFPLPSQQQSEISPTTQPVKSSLLNPHTRGSSCNNPLFIPDDDDVLEDITLDLSHSSQPQPTLLSQLIKDPTSDRQLNHKSQPQSLNLHDFLTPDPSSKK